MSTYAVHPHQVISEAQHEQLLEDGFLLLPRFIPEAELPELQAMQRRVLKTWDEVRHDPPPRRTVAVPFPHNDPRAARKYYHPELLRLGRWWLKTEDVFAREGMMLARYPGYVADDGGHIDNGNNSLLPVPEHAREYSQIIFWIHLEEVRPDQAPLRLVRRRDGRDLSKGVDVVCPAGSIAVFTTSTWHASTSFTASDGQRFMWAFSLGRADHRWEGFRHYTMLGQDPVFVAAVASMTPEERILMRFPPPGHPYYTLQTLTALERQYPGWDASGAYRSALKPIGEEPHAE